MQFRLEIIYVTKLCTRLKIDSTLFNFEYNGSVVRGIYFVNTLSLLLGIEDFNVSWFMQFDEKLTIVPRIPNDIFNKIKSHFYNSETNKYETKAFYEKVKYALRKLTLNQLERPTNDVIKKYLKATYTKDKYYDNEDKKPFFFHWRRQPMGKYPTTQNLNKTEKYFGKKIRNICKERHISSIWTTKENEHCLDFINLNEVEKDLLT